MELDDIGYEGLKWIIWLSIRDQWLALVNTVRYLRTLHEVENLLTS